MKNKKKNIKDHSNHLTDIQSPPPFISVIIPFFNRKKWIKSCLESVLSSSLSNIEVICVDDGSSDDGISIVRKIAKKDPRIRVLQNPHKGVYKARWDGVTFARGEYIHFMDSDDLIEKDAYETLYRICKDHDLDNLIFPAKAFNSSKHTQSELQRKTLFDKHYTLNESCCNTVMDGKDLFTSLSSMSSFFVGFPMRLIRRQILLERGTPECDAYWHADNFYTVVWLYRSKRAMAINQVMYNRRVHWASISMTKGGEEQHFESLLVVLLAFCHVPDFVERAMIYNSQEYKYMYRMIKGLNKRRIKIDYEKMMEIIDRYSEKESKEFMAFIKIGFINLMSRFSKQMV